MGYFANNVDGELFNAKPWPTYSLQNMPRTSFTCHNKIIGGYYADAEAECQMFHVCVKVVGVGVNIYNIQLIWKYSKTPFVYFLDTRFSIFMSERYDI